MKAIKKLNFQLSKLEPNRQKLKEDKCFDFQIQNDSYIQLGKIAEQRGISLNDALIALIDSEYRVVLGEQMTQNSLELVDGKPKKMVANEEGVFQENKRINFYKNLTTDGFEDFCPREVLSETEGKQKDFEEVPRKRR